MLSQLRRLKLETEGRYATDAELQVLTDYVQSFKARLQAYEALQATEDKVVQEAMTTIATRYPEVFRRGGETLMSKWKNDTVRVWRYTAITVLMNDPTTFQECFLLWFQTIMRSFDTQKSCDITYSVMQDVAAHHLPSESLALVSPVLELNRQVLSQKS